MAGPYEYFQKQESSPESRIRSMMEEAIAKKRASMPIQRMPYTKDSFPEGGPFLDRGPYRPKPPVPGEAPAIQRMPYIKPKPDFVID